MTTVPWPLTVSYRMVRFAGASYGKDNMQPHGSAPPCDRFTVALTTTDGHQDVWYRDTLSDALSDAQNRLSLSLAKGRAASVAIVCACDQPMLIDFLREGR